MDTDLSEPPRVDRILVLRGIACLLVLLNHVVGKLTESFEPALNAGLFAPLLVPLGFPCVWLFFILSSFLLTKAYLDGRFTGGRNGLLHFYKTRALRLLPLFILVQGLITLAVSLSNSPFFLRSSPIREASILFAAPWTPYFGRTQAVLSINSPVWSVLIEFHFILLLPLAVGLLRRTRALHVAFLAAWAVTVLGYAIRGLEVFPGFYQGHFYNAGFLVLGQMLAWKKHREPNAERGPFLPALVLLAAAWLAVQVDAYQHLQRALSAGALLLMPAFWLLILRLDTSYQKRLPGSYREIAERLRKGFLLETLGAMSYSIYLCHKPLADAIILGLSPGSWVSGWPCFLIAIASLVLVLLAVSTLMYVEVENRFRYRSPPIPRPSSTD